MKKYIFPAENCRFHVNFSERTIQNTALHIHDFYEWELVLSGDAITELSMRNSAELLERAASNKKSQISGSQPV